MKHLFSSSTAPKIHGNTIACFLLYNTPLPKAVLIFVFIKTQVNSDDRK